MSSVIDNRVEVQLASEATDVPDEALIRGWVEVALAGRTCGSEVTVRVVGQEEMQALNRDYRDADKPTNVLSFPAGDLDGPPQDVARPLGDVVICARVVRDEAIQQGKAHSDHWAHMLVHGALHLLGYDHITESDAKEMEALEREVLAGQGIADPYRVV